MAKTLEEEQLEAFEREMNMLTGSSELQLKAYEEQIPF